jgi:hypothetical protein
MDLSVLWCRSKTGKDFPVGQLSADTDLVTNELVCLTSVDGAEIVVTKLTEHEYNSDDMQACEQRVNKQLGRADLRIVPLAQVSGAGAATGKTFQTYLANYKSPTLFFRDILAGVGDAQVVREQTASEYKSAGGKIVVLGEV